jgi:hypothetical protein
MGVWNPAGGEPRPGSGLLVDEGREEIRVLTLSTEGRVRYISPNELEEYLRDPASVIWADILRPHEGAEALLRTRSASDLSRSRTAPNLCGCPRWTRFPKAAPSSRGSPCDWMKKTSRACEPRRWIW